jgi:hypothetical protein
MGRESFITPDRMKQKDSEAALHQRHSSWMDSAKNILQGTILLAVLGGGGYDGLAKASEVAQNDESGAEQKQEANDKKMQAFFELTMAVGSLGTILKKTL